MHHQDNIVLARFTPNGRYIVTGSRDGTAAVWDASSGQPRTRPVGTGEPIYHLAVSTDSRHLVTASQDHKARIWEIATGIQVGQKATKITFLHAARNENRSTLSKTVLAHYILRYTDGSEHRIPVESGTHLRDWRFSPTNPLHLDENERLRAIWTGANTGIRWAGGAQPLKLRFFQTSWDNPHPTKTIETIDLVSTAQEAGVFVLAITVN